MRDILLWAAILTAPACAQSMVDPSTPGGKTVVAGFTTALLDRNPPKLACDIRRYTPAIDFGLRVWSGFNATLPASQFQLDKGDQGVLVFRVTPKAAPQSARYFWQRFNLPPQKPAARPSAARLELSLGGGFLIGRGDYRVELILMDTRGRQCRKSWSVGHRINDASLLTPPDTVEPLDAENWPGFAPDGAGRATIFVHAAPVWPRRYVTRLSSWDRQILMSSLNSLLRNTGYRSACVVVFDLERRKVLYREPNFSRASLRRLGRQLAAVDLSTISMDTIRAGRAPDVFIEELLRAELKDPKPSDSFIFLGTTWRAGQKLRPMPADLLESIPKTWFLAFRHPSVVDSDTVSSLVRQVRGRTFNLYRPADLAAAIRNMTESSK